jgi:hypothetical protein
VLVAFRSDRALFATPQQERLMFEKTRWAAAAVLASLSIGAADAATGATVEELAQIRAQIQAMKDEYEARIRALERRLQQAEAKADQVAAAANAGSASAPTTAMGPAVQPVASGSSAGANAFNPAIALTLAGTYAHLSQDPSRYVLQGFAPSGEEVGPGRRGFSLGESELTLSANVDPRFSGQLTFSVSGDNAVAVEEALVRASGLAAGANLTAGRFLSGIGYQNSVHAHAWDFLDAPLAYQAFFGGQHKTDGLQLRWLAPLDQFLELGLEAGRGATFPGTERDKNGASAWAAYAHLGDDIGTGGSWRVGLSYLRTSAADRPIDDTNRIGADVVDAFSGTSRTWIADAIFKWAPDGNATQTNFKLQAEYFRRTEAGTLTYDALGQSGGPLASAYRSVQSGWYAQGVYQFMPGWRVGVRYDRLGSGAPRIAALDDGTLDAADFARLIAYNPSRGSAMVDWSPSEFSRVRVQWSRERSRPGHADDQMFLQYIMSLGAHGAHAF